MFLQDLLEEKREPRTIVVYPGRFQLFTDAHKEVYEHLIEKFGQENVFVATSDKVEQPDSPFDFEEKRTLMVAAGVPEDKISMETSPYSPQNLLSNFDPNMDKVIYAVGEKDMEEPNPRFEYGRKKSGELRYFQKMSSDMKPFGEHGYIYVHPSLTTDEGIVKSATKLRKFFRDAFKNNEKRKIANMIDRLYGSDDVDNKEIWRVLSKMVKVNEVSPDLHYGRTQHSDPDTLGGKHKVFMPGMNGKVMKQAERISHSLEYIESIINDIEELEAEKTNPKVIDAIHKRAMMLRRRVKDLSIKLGEKGFE